MTGSLWRRSFAELVGTLALLAVVVGSGIMGERLSGGNIALALLANSFATGLGLFVLISLLSPISGAHLNPIVTAVDWFHGAIGRREAASYALAQLIGAILGVALGNMVFDQIPFSTSVTRRIGLGAMLSECVATAGLVITILVARKNSPTALPALVGSYIAAAYWFTASTSFANPSVTIARTLTASFTGIAPASVGGFLLAQAMGSVLALVITRLLLGARWDPMLREVWTETTRTSKGEMVSR